MTSRKLAFVTAFFLALTAAAAGPNHGLDPAGMDRSVKPGNDFYAYANGTWTKNTPIPPDRSSVGVFSILDEKANERTSKLIQDADQSKAAANSEERKIGDFYAAFMDEKAIESRGLKTLQPELDQIAAIADKSSLARVLGSQLRADVDALNNTNFYTDRPFGLWVSPDINNPVRNVPYMLQGGLGLPDRDNYLGTEAGDVELQTKYRAHVAAILKLAGIADAEAAAARI